MSERISHSRRKISTSKRRTSNPPPSPAPSHNRRKTPDPTTRNRSSSRHVAEVIHRSSSDPCLWSTARNNSLIGDNLPDFEQLLYRPQTCTDVFFSPDWPKINLENKYKMDDKVVMNVTVEGSPGPVRVMLKLGWTVEETIKLVVNKYVEEGRTPILHKNDVLSSTFELHHSCFSLHCLDRSDVIGDLGSRSFYLRMRKTETSIIGQQKEIAGFIARKISEVIRRTHKLWVFLGCIPFDE